MRNDNAIAGALSHILGGVTELADDLMHRRR
jgi:hypothetical protein